MANIVSKKDGTTITGIPDGIDPQDQRLKDLMAKARAQGVKTISWPSAPEEPKVKSSMMEPMAPDPTTQSAPVDVPSDTPRASESPEPTQSGSTDFSLDPSRSLGAVYRGVMPTLSAATAGGAVGGPAGAGAGAALMGAAQLVGDPLTDLYNQYIVPNLPEDLKKSVLGKQMRPSDALQQLFTSMGVPDPQSASEKILQAIAQGASNAGSFAGGAKTVSEMAPGVVKGLVPAPLVNAGEAYVKSLGNELRTPGIVKGSAEALAAQPIQQIAGGAASAGAVQVAADNGADPLTQLGVGLAAGVGGAGLGGLKTVPRGALPADVALAEQNGIRVMSSDINPPAGPVGRFVQHLTERNPFLGSGTLRAKQQTERVAAVKSMLDEYGVGQMDNVSEQIMADLANEHSAQLGKYVQDKRSVIDSLSQPKLAGTTPVPPKPVVMDATTAAIDAQIAKLKSLKTESVNPVISRLEDWKQAIQGQSLDNIEELRKQIGETFADPQLAHVRSTSEKALSSIYPAVKQDMGDFIKAQAGQDEFNKWAVANAKLSDMMGDLKNSALKTTLEKGDMTPENVNKLLFSAKPSDVQMIYKQLSPDGRAAARTSILERAAKNATIKDGTVSPEIFATQVRKLGDQIGIFFSDGDLERVKGLTRALNLTKRAPEAIVDPPTGLRTFIPTSSMALASFFGGGWNGFLGAVGAGFGLGALTRLYESKAVRDILLKIPQTVQGSKEEAALVKRLISNYTTLEPSLKEGGTMTDDLRKQFFYDKVPGGN